MRKITEMASDCGAIFDEEAKLFVFDEEELTAFYHESRAKALMDAADWFNIMEPMTGTGKDDVAAESLRIMANSEGKE